MAKPLTSHRQGFAVEKLEPILPQATFTNQLFLLIHSHQLTEVLEWFETIGITNDTAILMLVFFKKGAA